MAKFWVSGSQMAATVKSGASATDSEHLLGAAITTGRALWLTGLWVPTVTGLQQVVAICDDATTLSATGVVGTTGPTKKMRIWLPSATSNATAGGPDNRVNFITIPPPGLRFTSGCVIYQEATVVHTVGSFGGCGYEV